MKKIIDSKPSFFLLASSILFAFLSLIFYAVFGKTIFNPKLDSLVFVFLGLVISTGIISIFLPSKLVESFSFYFSILSILFYFRTQATYIANVFVAIDGTTFSASFLMTFFSFILTMVLAVLAMSFEKKDFPSFRKEKD